VSHFDDLRRDYAGIPLAEAAAGGDPYALFDRWFGDAVAGGIELANGMVLATVGPDGRPSARVVLLKDWDREGFVFFTNYLSRKGHELAANPAAALLFWWEPLHRQIRIEGTVSRLDAAASDAYFASRPRPSNLAAMASAQSQPVASREALEATLARTAADWADRVLVRPAHWGGFRLRPTAFEFWQGREDRLHDRLVYRDGPAWIRERLCP
jgi:pyridoxamine 5'-phosphate oxidase